MNEDLDKFESIYAVDAEGRLKRILDAQKRVGANRVCDSIGKPVTKVKVKKPPGSKGTRYL